MRISSLLTLAVLALSAAANASPVLLQDFDGNGVVTGPGTSGTVFNQPSFSGSTASKLDTTTYNASEILPDQSVSPPNSLRVGFQFLDAAATGNWVRLTTFGPDPLIDLNGAVAFDALLLPADTAAPIAPLGIGLGIREVTKAAGTPLGSDGGTSGSIEWVGITDSAGGGPNPTRWLQPGAWTPITFFPSAEPSLGFTGDGIVSTASGLAVLEHLALRAPAVAGATGPGPGYHLFLDNIRVYADRNEIPEPATLSLLGLGLLPLIRRKK